jgi:tRNA A-37 threonylcarbamoyl transferase component Bud32
MRAILPATPSKETVFAGTERFVVQRRLGVGAMGVVYEALDRARGQRVALKTLRRPDPALLYRLKKEFRALAEIAHPNLVALHELHQHEDRWFFTMELIEGVGFLEWVRPGAAERASTQRISSSSGRGSKLEVGGALDVARLREALRQLTSGVAALHEAGKLHRDLKPSNVLVTPAGQVKICDFGLVTDAAAHEQTRSRHAMGTPLYMSPEQAANQPLSKASDWYSVGAMLYVALAGRAPFAGSSFVIMRDKQLFEPPPPGAVAAGVPDDLDALCVRLLARDPQKRVPEASEPPRANAADAADLEQAFAARGTVVFERDAPRVRRFLDRLAAEKRAVVLTSRCRERESVRYQALDGLVDALSAYLRRTDGAALLPANAGALARLFPVLHRVGAITESDGDPIAALRELFDRLARLHPLVLCIEDVQWGDAESAAALRAILAPPMPPILVLLTAPHPVDWLS